MNARAPKFATDGIHQPARRIIEQPSWEEFNRLRIDRACLAAFSILATVIIVALCAYIVVRIYAQ